MGWAFRSIVGLATLLIAAGLSASPASANSKYAAFVVHAESGDILFDRYSNGRRYPASLTKVMTLYLLFEELEAGRVTLNTKMKISKRAAGQPPSKLGLKAGSTITVEDAIKALIVRSANDVAVVVAEHIGGSEWQFAQKMTKKARSLGMPRTTFRNASGLPNSKQVTTARDMATLGARVSQDFPQHFHYFSTKQFTWGSRTYRSHNKLVGAFDGADGLKTGYTRRSGFNLATTAERDGQRLIGVVLGGRSGATRDRHMREILNRAFSDIKKRPALISSLHRKKPAPRIKPTLMAKLEAERAVPTIAENEALRDEIRIAAASIGDMSAPETTSVLSDGMPLDKLGALIASTAQSDDFNEYERARLESLTPSSGFIGMGDRVDLSEFAWSVQIGAYSSKAMAQKELEDAAFKGGLQDRARKVIPAPRKDGVTLYRARITALSETEASAACETLKARSLSCFVIAGPAPPR